MRPFPSLRFLLLVPALAVSAMVLPRAAVAAAPAPQTAAETARLPEKARHQLLLVLPFDNRTDQANLDWIGEAVSEILNQRLGASGFDIISRDDRQYALEHLGLPRNFSPSRATSIRLAQTLDADDVIVGFYGLSGTTLQISARILDVNDLRLGPPLMQSGPLDQLLDVLDSTAWKVASGLDPKFPLPESSFHAASANLRLNGFENYIRGILATDSTERIRRLKIAVTEDPRYAPAWLALGMTYFSEQQFDNAADALGHLPKTDRSALMAEFYRGLAFFYTGHYDEAETAFAFIAAQLPLPEVVNDEGVAAARRGHDAGALFQQAIQADPHDPDYQFNLAIALARRGDRANALSAINQALKLRPEDSEALAFQKLLQQPNAPLGQAAASPQPSADSTPGAAPAENRPSLPLERIKRSYNDASFRQAASEMEEMEAERLASLPPDQQAAELAKNGNTYLNRGLMLEAERQFQLAVTANPNDADAHAGLAEVRRRNGDDAQARTEAETSLKLRPNAAAWLTLARLDRWQHHLPAERDDIHHALEIDPRNPDALGLEKSLPPAAPTQP